MKWELLAVSQGSHGWRPQPAGPLHALACALTAGGTPGCSPYSECPPFPPLTRWLSQPPFKIQPSRIHSLSPWHHAFWYLKTISQSRQKWDFPHDLTRKPNVQDSQQDKPPSSMTSQPPSEGLSTSGTLAGEGGSGGGGDYELEQEKSEVVIFGNL